MQGLTITASESWEKNVFEVSHMLTYPHPYLSIEPILGCFVGIKIPQKIEIVIVGAMTGPGAVVPKHEWIQSIKDNIEPDKIYWKKNIREYL